MLEQQEGQMTESYQHHFFDYLEPCARARLVLWPVQREFDLCICLYLWSVGFVCSQ